MELNSVTHVTQPLFLFFGGTAGWVIPRFASINPGVYARSSYRAAENQKRVCGLDSIYKQATPTGPLRGLSARLEPMPPLPVRVVLSWFVLQPIRYAQVCSHQWL